MGADFGKIGSAARVLGPSVTPKGPFLEQLKWLNGKNYRIIVARAVGWS